MSYARDNCYGLRRARAAVIKIYNLLSQPEYTRTQSVWREISARNHGRPPLIIIISRDQLRHEAEAEDDLEYSFTREARV